MTYVTDERGGSMSSHDVDFDAAAANSWRIEVEMELEKVNQVLREVSETCTTIPGEQDTIMKGIEATGKVMSDAWSGLCNGFQQMCSLLGELFSKREASINKVSDSIDAYKSNFRL